MKIIAIREMSVGNESVGAMWKETKIFEETATLKEVMSFLGNDTRKNIILSVAQEDLRKEDIPF